MNTLTLLRIDCKDRQQIDFHINHRIPFIITNQAENWSCEKIWNIEYFRRYEVVDNAVLLNNYLRNWSFWRDYPELLTDYCIPKIFSTDYSPFLTRHIHALKWIFIGNAGTMSASHYDIFYSSAWLYLAEGLKHWRFLKESVDDKPQVINLFDDAQLRDHVVWEGIQKAGDIIWVPPKTRHAVVNQNMTIALSHNYIDATNIEIALRYPELSCEQKAILTKIISELGII